MGPFSTRSKFREGDMKRVEAALVSLCSKMAREGETGWDAQLRKLCVATVEAVCGSGQVVRPLFRVCIRNSVCSEGHVFVVLGVITNR